MPPAADLVVHGGTLVDQYAEYPGVSLAASDGRIEAVGNPELMPAARETIDARGLYVLPGVVDAHVHFRDPGLTYKEGFGPGSGAAAIGGVTCVCDMPNTEPPINTAERVNTKVGSIAGRSWVDFALYGLLGPGDGQHLIEAAHAGVIGFKVFLGQSEVGPGCPSPPDDGELYEAMETIAQLGLRLAVHAENHAIMQRRIAHLKRSGAGGLQAHRDSRPPLAEVEAIQRVGLFARYSGCPIHIVHVSSADAITAVRQLRSSGVDITAETCPHYLVSLSEPDDLMLRVNPPIRGEVDRQALGVAVRTGDLDFVASDHAPHAPSEKAGSDVWTIRPGLIGVQHLLQLLWGLREELRLTLPDIVRLTSFGPARTWGIWPRKGSFLPGADADITIVDPARSWAITQESIQSRHPNSCYLRMRGIGCSIITIVRGTVVAREGRLLGAPTGQLVRRCGEPHD